jgi:UDP-N-acetylglucosamine 2-epimerase (non-hydrolysing)
MKYAYLILTDSGGIQEEAPSLRKPVLVMRKVTERKEAINTGNVKLIGNEKKNIIFNVRELLNNENMYMKMCNKSNPYGDGFAAKRIVDFLKNLYFEEI